MKICEKCGEKMVYRAGEWMCQSCYNKAHWHCEFCGKGNDGEVRESMFYAGVAIHAPYSKESYFASLSYEKVLRFGLSNQDVDNNKDIPIKYCPFCGKEL